MNYAIVLSGGKGTRMGLDIPKQYYEILGHPIIYYSLKAFQNNKDIDRIIIVTAKEYESYFKSLVKEYGLTKVYAYAYAGKERYDSVYSGLLRIPTDDLIDQNYCLIHDGARPLITDEIINNCLADVKKYSACVAAVPAKDTIKVANSEGMAIKTPDRRSLYQVQTPQAFANRLIFDAYKQMYDRKEFAGVTDDAMLVSKFAKREVYLTKSDYRNIKATTPEDLKIIELFLKEMQSNSQE